jgi:hypothetical protein
MTKQEAEREALARWHRLPVQDRQDFRQAFKFAERVENDFDFRTMADKRKMIACWLIRDLERTRIGEAFRKAS